MKPAGEWRSTNLQRSSKRTRTAKAQWPELGDAQQSLAAALGPLLVSKHKAVRSCDFRVCDLCFIVQKKDWWLVLLVWTAVLLPFALGACLLISGKTEAGWYLLFVGAVTGAVVLWLTYPLNYEITASMLIVRSGFMRKEILLSSIEEVCPTKNPLSAPAWSLDRL